MSDGRKMFVLVLAAVLIIAFAAGCAEKDRIKIKDAELRIDAASAFYPMTEMIAENVFDEACYSDAAVTLVATAEGFEDLVSGKTDLLITSMPDEEQEKLLEASGEEFVILSLRTEPLVILVNKENPVESLSIEALLGLYHEKDQNWSSCGGKDLPVTTYQLAKGNGSRTAFSQYTNEIQTGQGHREVTTMPAIIDAVGEDPGGICYAFASYYYRMHSNAETKAVRIDGKSIDDREYPLTCEVCLYYRKDNANPSVKKNCRFPSNRSGEGTDRNMQ